MMDILDKTESLLAHLICADASGEDCVDAGGRRIFSDGTVFAETDTSVLLPIMDLSPVIESKRGRKAA